MIASRITRREAVDLLRDRLAELVDDDHCLCDVASKHGVFCRGFSQWSLDELKQRYDWIADRCPHITRSELEFRANAWQLARKQLTGMPTACDVQQEEHDTCFGWEEFTPSQLRFYLHDLAGIDVEVEDADEFAD